MNGDDPQRNARTRRMPPPGRPGEPPMPRRMPPPASGGPPQIEPTQVMRRDGTAGPHAHPLAYSQVPPEPPRRMPPPAPARRHAPTQRPVPHQEGPPHARTQRPVRYDGGPPHAPTREPRPYREGPPPVPPRGARPARAPRPRRKRHPFRWFLVIVLVLVLAAVGAVIKLDNSLNRIPALANYAQRVGDTPGTNWLLVGSDGRGGLSPEQERELATGGEVGPERTDTIMLVHVPKSGKTTLVSLPRDSYVSIPGQGKDKLNAAFAIGGPALLVQTVEIATGLRIDHYAQIGFGGFASVVDTLGGIDVCVPKPIDDPLAGIDLPAGCQRLNGPQALGFVRSRATALADLDRMNNQRIFMAALLKKATSGATLANPFKLWPLASDTAKSLKVDNGDHIWHLGGLGWALRGETVATAVPVGGFDDTASGNVVLWDKEKASRFFDALADDRAIPEDLLTR
ncbi:LCP family protein [Streptomyces gardneri]|uniref:LCP family protein n=1 Tax=Nocardia TaxID=1817 RepID=UPI001893D21A|nr:MULTISPECIES: LCP family protein [Nocardia]MBF6164391.1 LCP family protein [Streptomyces gardneri]MBF6204929.1 LCP family protein [Streptomyces gardneri]